MAAKFNAKQFLVSHGEKLGLGVVVLLVLFALATANWVPYGGDPYKITSDAEAARVAYEARKITPEEETQLELVVPEDKRPAELVQRQILEDWPADSWNLRILMAASPSDSKIPLKEVQPLFERHPIMKLEALTSWVHLNLGPEDPPPAAEETPAADGTPAPPTLAAATPLPPGAPNLDEEFERRAAGSGASGPGMAGSEYMQEFPAGYGSSPELDYYASYMSGDGGSGMMSGEGAGYGGTRLKGRGQFFVSVRGIIPLHELIRDVAEARNCDFAQAAQYFQLIDYHLDRQMANADGTWPADDQWEAVDRQTAISILEEVDGFDLDPVPPQLTDPAVTMPLPARITGQWGRYANHPDLESFSLSPEDMDNEMKYQRALLTKLQEQEAQQKAATIEQPTVKARGWSDHVYSTNRMAQQYIGSESSYSTEYESYSSGMSEQNAFGTMSGYGGPQADQKLTQLAKELATVVDKKAQDKALEDYIKNRVTAVGNVLLFRYVDFAIEPGKTYRYRARMEIENPNYQERVADAAVPSVVEGETRFNSWSNITKPVTVEPMTHYFVHKIDPRKNAVDFDFYHRDSALGTIVTNTEPDPPEDENVANVKRLSIGFGEPVGGTMEIWELAPGHNTFAKDDQDVAEDEDPKGYSFQTGDVLITALEDYSPARSEHPDLKMPREQNFDLQLVDAVLVQNRDGTLNQIDTISQQAWLNYMTLIIGKQNEPWRDLKAGLVPEGGEGCPLAALYMEAGYMGESMGSDGGSRRSNTRERSLLRKSGSRADAGGSRGSGGARSSGPGGRAGGSGSRGSGGSRSGPRTP